MFLFLIWIYRGTASGFLKSFFWSHNLAKEELFKVQTMFISFEGRAMHNNLPFIFIVNKLSFSRFYCVHILFKYFIANLRISVKPNYYIFIYLYIILLIVIVNFTLSLCIYTLISMLSLLGTHVVSSLP